MANTAERLGDQTDYLEQLLGDQPPKLIFAGTTIKLPKDQQPYFDPEAKVTFSADDYLRIAKQLPAGAGATFLVSVGMAWALEKLQQPNLSRRNFLKATGAALGLLVLGASGCGTSPTTESPDQTGLSPEEKSKNWSTLGPRQRVLLMETGFGLNPDLSEIASPYYDLMNAEHLRAALTIVVPEIGFERFEPVSGTTFLERVQAEYGADPITLEELKRKQQAAFASVVDNKVYLWVGKDSPFEQFKQERRPGYDAYAYTQRLATTHEAVHLLSVRLRGDRLPAELAYMYTPFGMAAVDEIRGFAILGHYLDPETNKPDPNRPFSMTAIEEAATELINQERTQAADLNYTNVTNYGEGVKLFKEVLRRTGMTWKELERVKREEGLPRLLKVWKEKVGNGKSKVGALVNLFIDTTQRKKPFAAVLSELDIVLPQPQQ